MGQENRYFSEASFLRRVVKGQMPLVITAHSADVITCPAGGQGGSRRGSY